MPPNGYTLVCGYEYAPGVKCEKVIAQSKSTGTRPHGSYRPVKYGLCGMHRTGKYWNHRDAPLAREGA